MATTTELIALDHHQVGLVLLFDGVEIGFTNNSDLVGIDDDVSHTVRLGLELDGLSVKLAVDLRTGQWLDSPAKVPIVDYEGDIATMFSSVASDERSLGDVPLGTGTPVGPLSNLAARPELDSMNIGLERIGSAGERHQFPVPASFDALGLDHRITTPALDLAGAPVSAGPLVWNGRRCALYLCFRDHVTYPDRAAGPSSWRPFSEAPRLWCGTVRDDGEVSGREWTIDVDGPDSLLRKPLGVGMATTPVAATGDITLVTSGEGREDLIGVALRSNALTSAPLYFGNRFTAAITGTTVDAIRADIIAEIAAVAALAGVDGIWDAQNGFKVEMTEDGSVSIGVSVTAGLGRMVLTLHRTAWAALGYHINEQNALHPDYDDVTALKFSVSTSVDHYYRGYFYTGVDGENFSAAVRIYRPLYLGGTSVLLEGLNQGAGQVIRLADATLGGGASQSTVAHPGQLAWPVASLPTNAAAAIQIDGVDCNRTGWWLFFGKRRYAGSEEVFDERWIGLACWTNGSAQQDGLVSGDVIIVTHWFDASMFGYKTASANIGGDWIARADADPDTGLIQAIPIAMLGYHAPAPDLAHIVLQRLLYSTGTSTGWDDFELNTPALVAGSNDPGGVAIDRDAELASLGLAIPEEWIAPVADFGAVAARVDNQSILDVKVAFTAGYQADDVLRSLMQPVGWSWHFRDGRLGIWCPSDPLTLADATVTLNRSIRTGASHSRQQIRKFQPADRFKIAADWKPLERTAGNSFERQAPDPQYPYRPGQSTISILAHGMRKGGAGLQERLIAISRWLAQRHFEVKNYPVPPIRPGLELWPGTIVNLTDPALLDPATGYGVTGRVAIVTATQRSWAQDPDSVSGDVKATMTVDLLVLGHRTSTPRMFAPLAQPYGYNTATERLHVRDDWAGHGNDWADAAAFVEPSWSTLGGNAIIRVYQWDGVSWASAITGEVLSVVTTVGSAYLQLDNVTGTYYRDRDSWVVLDLSTGVNAAWVEAYFATISSAAGEWTDDAAATQDYHPWET